MMTFAEVVKTSVSVITKSPSQDHSHPEDHPFMLYKVVLMFKSVEEI